MASESFDPRIRAAALSIMRPILESDVMYRGRLAVSSVSEALGISRDQAAQLVAEYSQAKDLNAFPGNIRELPNFNPGKPADPQVLQSELYQRTMWFTLGYVEDVTEYVDHSAIFDGQYWLGNSPEDTRALVKNLQENPDQVVSYIRWGFQNDPSLENMLDQFSKRAKEGKLRPPSLEE